MPVSLKLKQLVRQPTKNITRLRKNIEAFAEDAGGGAGGGGSSGAAMKAVAGALHSHVIGNFAEQRDPWGEPWAPHSPVTLEKRVRSSKSLSKLTKGKRRGSSVGRGLSLVGHLASAKKLIDKGPLRTGVVSTSTRRTARVGVSGPSEKYAPAQQFGNPKNKLPQKSGTFRSKHGKSVTVAPRKAPIPQRSFLPLRLEGGQRRIDLPDELRTEIIETIRDSIWSGVR